jgi:hypothetical protein
MTTAKIIRKIANWQEVASYLHDRRSQLATPETAKCASGRHNFWLQAEPIYYGSTPYKRAIADDRLWTWIQKIWSDAQVAQVFYANRNIDWHRDASYAKPLARIISLGNSVFEIESHTGEFSTAIEQRGQTIEFRFDRFTLSGGDVLEFNCKNLHRAASADIDRIGIGLWQCKIPIPANL